MINYNDTESNNSRDMQVDSKVVKRCYPRTCNDSVCEVVFDADPNNCLRMDKIKFHFKVDVPANYVVDNGFASKLFTNLTVEVDSQIVSNYKTR